MGEAIEVREIGVEFAINRKVKMRARDFFVHGFNARPTERFWALRNVGFSVAPGESVGFVGANGSGKSTLLKVIAGVISPDEGSVEVAGPVAPLISLGAGFSPELSGRENVYLNGTILGLSKSQIAERFDAIVRFADVRRFLDTPLKHYSSGMKVRLGFAIVTQLDHPILLIDEVLAVGDKAFRKKCYAAMEEMAAGGRTMVIVSHNAADIERFCGRSIYLREGRLIADGPTPEVLEQYNADVDAKK